MAAMKVILLDYGRVVAPEDGKEANLEHPSKLGFHTVQVVEPLDAVNKISRILNA